MAEILSRFPGIGKAAFLWGTVWGTDFFILLIAEIVLKKHPDFISSRCRDEPVEKLHFLAECGV